MQQHTDSVCCSMYRYKDYRLVIVETGTKGTSQNPFEPFPLKKGREDMQSSIRFAQHWSYASDRQIQLLSSSCYYFTDHEKIFHLLRTFLPCIFSLKRWYVFYGSTRLGDTPISFETLQRWRHGTVFVIIFGLNKPTNKRKINKKKESNGKT